MVGRDGDDFLIRVCPYYERRADEAGRFDGYCRYLRLGDWQEGGTFSLWDYVNECGTNLD